MQDGLLQKGHLKIFQDQVEALLNKRILFWHVDTFDGFSLFHIVQISWIVWLHKVTKWLDELAILYHEDGLLRLEVQALKPENISWTGMKKNLSLRNKKSD